MAIVETHPEPIEGPWAAGFVLDRHVVSSQPLGYVGTILQFDTKRTPLGELVYRLKNRGGKPDDIVETAVAFVLGRWGVLFDCVVPPPPSVPRRNQPAVIIAAGIAGRLGIPAFPAAAVKAKPTPQMKNVPRQEREALLKSAIPSASESVRGRRVLLVDDLWETGSTLRRLASVLKEAGAVELWALAMTRTR